MLILDVEVLIFVSPRHDDEVGLRFAGNFGRQLHNCTSSNLTCDQLDILETTHTSTRPPIDPPKLRKIHRNSLQLANPAS
jgi:hypothetical protein